MLWEIALLLLYCIKIYAFQILIEYEHVGKMIWTLLFSTVVAFACRKGISNFGARWTFLVGWKIIFSFTNDTEANNFLWQAIEINDRFENM